MSCPSAGPYRLCVLIININASATSLFWFRVHSKPPSRMYARTRGKTMILLHTVKYSTTQHNSTAQHRYLVRQEEQADEQHRYNSTLYDPLLVPNAIHEHHTILTASHLFRKKAALQNNRSRQAISLYCLYGVRTVTAGQGYSRACWTLTCPLYDRSP